MCYSFDPETFILYRLKHAHSCLLFQKDCSHVFTTATHKVAKLDHTILVTVHISKVPVHQTHWKSFLREVHAERTSIGINHVENKKKKITNVPYKFLQILPTSNVWIV